MPTLEDAIALAVEAHRGQRDKAGQTYILHPLRVMMRRDAYMTEAQCRRWFELWQRYELMRR